MSRIEIVGIIMIVIIIIIGTSIKLYTASKLKDIDGMSDPYIKDETDPRGIVGKF